LDFDRLKEIKQRINIPVVLHWASGVPDQSIIKSISLGIRKINIDTDIRQAFTRGVSSLLAEKPKEYDPRKILSPAKEEMKKVIKGKMRLFGCSGKA